MHNLYSGVRSGKRENVSKQTFNHQLASCNTGFYGDEILYKNLNFFDKIFVPTFCRRRFRNSLCGEKIRASRGNFVTARSGTGMFSLPQAEMFLGLPEPGYGKTFPFVYRGMGTGREGGKAEG